MALRDDSHGVLVIGIDFGTTFTGVAYGYTKEGSQSLAAEPQSITLWPATQHGGADYDVVKVESKIAYTARGINAWGRDASDDPKHISWFKLLLLDEDDLQTHLKDSDHINIARGLVETAGKDPVTVISNYLSKIWNHVLEDIARAEGQYFVDSRPFHIVITVPAIWQDRERQRMFRAVSQAGILDKRPGCADTTHAFISEPEAAALTAIDGHRKYDILKPGQTFVVADLGGGTVDLVSFRVKTTKLQLEEVVEGEGGLCGATFLDQAFLTCIQEKLSKEKLANKSLKSWYQLHDLERKRILDIVWEKEIKRQYYPGQPGIIIDLGAQGNKRPKLKLEPDELNDIFDSVFEQISKLIKSQIDAILSVTCNMPEFIVLCGGFGRCEYIYRKLQTQYKGHTEILYERNDRPWTAVARGAVLSSVQNQQKQVKIHSRVSRYSYGWAKMEDFDHRIHHPEDLDTDELTGRCIARGQMEWIVLRGESVEAQKPRVYEYERFFEVHELGIISFSEPIYRSSNRDPPERLAENEAKEEIQDSSDERGNFQKHVIIDMKTPISVQRLPKKGGKEFPHRVLSYRVEVNISGASLVIKATSYGKNIGEMVISEVSV
ncbi:hypothetical protein F5Y19DRAFT_488376 [Xylariaceae sp. FL1651]|nr:hypothetical protein F5Y19DRAFT_488376 [Xylariaceae sp. FL1651]